MATILQKNRFFSENLTDEALDHSRWLLYVGFVFICLSLITIAIAISTPVMPELHSVAIIAGLVGVSGVVYLAHGVSFSRSNKWLSFSLHTLAGVAYLVAGYILYLYPLADIAVLSIILMVSYLLLGIFRVMTAMMQGINRLGWSWTLLCGITNLLLASIILFRLPEIDTGFIALIIGVELLFTGCSLLLLGFNAKREKIHTT